MDINSNLSILSKKFQTSRLSSVYFAIASNGEPYILLKQSDTVYYQLTFKSDGIELGYSANGTWNQLWRLS